MFCTATSWAAWVAIGLCALALRLMAPKREESTDVLERHDATNGAPAPEAEVVEVPPETGLGIHSALQTVTDPPSRQTTRNLDVGLFMLFKTFHLLGSSRFCPSDTQMVQTP